MATLNTRIQLKFDTYNNWVDNDIVLLKGEMGIAEIPASTGAVQQEPAYMLKIGDGTKKFSELDWVSGKAADVYSWAKAATKPTYSASEIDGLEEFISGEVKDTNTQYQIIKEGDMGFKLQKKDIGDDNFTDVTTITLVPPALTTGETNGTIKYGAEEVAVAGLQDAAFETIENIVAQAAGETDTKIQALDFSDSAVANQFVTTVSETDGVISVTRAQPEIANVSGLTEALAGKQDTVVFNTAYDSTSNKAATMTDVTNAVAGLSGAMHFVGESSTDPATGIVTIAESPYSGKSGDVVLFGQKEFVFDGTSWKLLGDEGSYAVKGAITNADIASGAAIDASKVSGLETALTDIAGLKTQVGEGNVADNISTAIGALDNSDAAVENQFVTAVTQTDGVVAVTRAQATIANISGLQTALDAKADDSALATVAKTGKVDDLTQTDVLILDCGSATVNV